MSCVDYYCTLITLDPDDTPIVIESGSPTGWYVLYKPETSSQAVAATPLPIYHVTSGNTYVGWTTKAPINCEQGSTNYPVGLCKLVVSRVEEAPTALTGISPDLATASKDSMDVVGRHVYPKIPSLANLELYCFYNFQQTNFKASKTSQTLLDAQFIIDNGWYLGMVSYRTVIGQSIVPNKVFGAPLTANIRSIGTYTELLQSLTHYNLSNLASDTLPVVNPSPPQPTVVTFNPLLQQIEVTDHDSSVKVLLNSDQPALGSITTSDSVTVNWSGFSCIVVTGAITNTNISLMGVTFPTYPVNITVSIGNQDYLITI